MQAHRACQHADLLPHIIVRQLSAPAFVYCKSDPVTEFHIAEPCKENEETTSLCGKDGYRRTDMNLAAFDVSTFI